MPIQSQRSRKGEIPNALPIMHFHGAPMEQYPCNSRGISCGDPNDLSITHFHGIPNDQPQCKPMESQCIAQNTSPWNSQWSLPIQSHKSHMGLGLPNVLHIRHLHGAPMEHYPCKSMGLTCAHHHDLPIEHSHGIPNEQSQCKSMESQCITHRAIPWNYPMKNPHPIP